MGWSNIRRRFGRRLGALAGRAEGAAAAELAIIVPVIGLVLSGTFDIAQFANEGMILDAAVRAGGSYAMANTNATEAQIQCIIGQAGTCTGGLTPYATYAAGTTVTVTFPNAGTFAPPQYCTWDNGSAIVSCDNNANPCSGAQCPKHFYVQTQAVQSGLKPLVLPWTGMPTNVQRTLTVRVQ